jgi:CRP-like cAMP-binding protein
LKLDLKDTKPVPLQEFVTNAKQYVVDLNNNECDEVVVTKEGNVPFLIMMKYAKMGLLIEGMVRSKIREIDDVVARSVRQVNLQQLSPAQASLLKIRSKLACFRHMSEADVMNVTNNVEFIQVDNNEMLFDQGHSGEKIFYILKGGVKIFAYNQEESDAKFRLLATLEMGAVIGEMAPITHEPRSARALASQDDTVLLCFEFHKEMVDENQKAMFQLYKNFVTIISKKLVETNNKLTARRNAGV